MNNSISDITTTKMSSKGQVVIPEEIRDFMNLESGAKFIVTAIGDSIILKKIVPITQRDIKKLLLASQEQAKKYRLKEQDVPKMISQVRKARKKAAMRKIRKKPSK